MAGGLKLMLRSFVALACIAYTLAAAQTLRDPTRPPASGAKAVPGKVESAGWTLQSVLISPQRRYAIINGEVVPLGGNVAGAELIAIAAERVTLRTREGMRVLHLFPDVTRLGAVDAIAGATEHTQAPDPGNDTKAPRSGHPGVKK